MMSIAIFFLFLSVFISQLTLPFSVFISFSLLSSFYIIFCFFSLPSSELSVVNFLQYAFLVSLVSSFHSSFFVCLSSFYTILSSFASLVSSVSLPLFSL